MPSRLLAGELLPALDGHIAKTWIDLDGTELVDEWRRKQAAATVDLCCRWVESYPHVLDGARPQQGAASSYSRRRPADSEIDPRQPLAEQFDLMRVVDNERYPAFFTWRGTTYELTITPRGMRRP